MDTQYMVSEVNTVDIMGTEITYKEWEQQQVVTFADIDAVHKRPSGTAKRNFSKNRDYFIEDKDYYNITPEILFVSQKYEKRTSGIYEVNPRGTIFLTERGYYKITKSMKDSLSWIVFDNIMDNYFHYRDILSSKVKDVIDSDNDELEFTIPWPKQIMSRLAPCIDYIKETTDPDASLKNTLGKINKMVTAKYGADFNQYTEAYKKANPNDERLYILSIVDYFPKLRKAYDDTVNQFINNALNM